MKTSQKYTIFFISRLDKLKHKNSNIIRPTGIKSQIRIKNMVEIMVKKLKEHYNNHLNRF